MTKEATEKRVKQAPQSICNEKQETIFNTDLSIAADEYTKAVKENKLWKERVQSTKKELCKQMKDAKLVQITVGTDKVIKYKYTAAKEDVVLSDYKAKTPARNRYSRR